MALPRCDTWPHAVKTPIRQRHAVCTLGELQTTIAREGLASPSVIVVGDVMQGLLAAAQVPEREPLGQTRTA